MATSAEIVREQLGESIPPGGTEADTNFTDDQIDDFLTRHDGDVDAATLSGWRAKAGMYAHLVDTQEGTSKRAMSDLHEHALRMVNSYGNEGPGATSRTRIHQIVRR